MKKQANDMSLLKRVYLKYIVGYKNPQLYWNKRWRLESGDALWRDEDARRKFIAMLECTLRQHDCTSFLDVGCGTAQLQSMPNYIGLDFSSVIKTIEHGDQSDFILADITAGIPLKNGSVDAVFVRTVLEHVPPSKINPAVAELCRVAKKLIIIVEPPIFTETQKHCFSHELKEMFKDFKGIVEYF